MIKMKTFLALIIFIPIISCSQNKNYNLNKNHVFKIIKSDKEWKKILTKEEYKILRKSGTERAFTGQYNYFEKKGVYNCKACNSSVYNSENKYDSGTGWPSFDKAIKNSILYQIDYKIGYARNEIICSQCGSHLGHMFKDGPKKTTGERHCINSLALNFKPKNDE